MKAFSAIPVEDLHLSTRGLLAGALLGFISAWIIFLPACSTGQVQSQSMKVEAAPVTVATAIQKTVPVELRAIGNVEAYSQVSVKSQVEGQLERVYFREGDDVKQGDLLFTIDRRPFEAALKQAEANLAKETAQATYARRQAERSAKLAGEGIISKDQYDQVRSNADALEAAIQADKAAIETTQVQLAYCTIRSPLDGRTGSLIVHPGNVVKANDATLVVINQTRPVFVNFSVPEKYLSEIKRHMAAGSLRVAATIPGEEKRPLGGGLSFVDNTVDMTTGTIHLKGTFANPEKRLWPGQFVNVSLTLASEPNAIVVPSEAVQTGQQGSYVFIVKPDLSVDVRPVVVGAAVGSDTVVEKGIQLGETVVTDGQLRLYPGAKVEVKGSKT
jgi:multidrug efflux system membrane fusion protein